MFIFVLVAVSNQKNFKDSSKQKAIAKINEQKLFAVKIKNNADISNKRKKIKKSIISAIFFIKLIELFLCNH